MTEFTCIGFDIRMKNSNQPFSADATVWDQNEELYEYATQKMQINENVMQLLHPQNADEMLQLIELVSSKSNAALVSFEVPTIVFESHPHRTFVDPPIPLVGSRREWKILGIDVCDINGFFSYLDMNESFKKPMAMFEEMDLLDAFALAQAANFVIPAHAPFVLVRLGMHAP